MTYKDYLLEEMLAHLETEDIAYFQEQNYCPEYLHEVFYYCCYKNKSPAFVDAIVALGVTDFVHGCVTGALLQGHCRLLEHIFIQYGKKHRINLFEYDTIDICYYVVSLLLQKENFKLFEMIVNALPNHTKIVKKKDKYYNDEKNRYHSFSYEFVCQNLLAITIEEFQRSNCDLDTVRDAIAIISRKKFPLTKSQSFVIRALDDALKHRREKQFNPNFLNHEQSVNDESLDKTLPPDDFSFVALFQNRLKPRHGDLIDHRIASPHAMASHHTLNASMASVDKIQMKMRLYLEITESIKVPKEIGSIIYEAFTREKRPEDKRKLVSPECVRWMQNFKENKKNYLFNFFNKHINFERSLLPLTLQADFEQYDSEEDNLYVKI